MYSNENFRRKFPPRKSFKLKFGSLRIAVVFFSSIYLGMVIARESAEWLEKANIFVVDNDD